MSERRERPSFSLDPFKLGRAWSLTARWPDGLSERVGGFTCKDEAAAWIARHSDSWIARTESDRPRRPRHPR